MSSASEPDPGAAAAEAQARTVRLYQVIAVLMLLTLGLLIVYAIRLGPIVGPGVTESFGLAVAMMFLAAAMIMHLVDRTYRVWPTGRRVRPPVPAVITDAGIAFALKVLVVVLAVAAIAYVVSTLVS